MRKTILIISLMMFIGSIQAQSIEREVIASSGMETEQLSWTVGETVVGTHEQGTVVLTQGYQQGYYSITQKIEETAVDFDIEVYPNPVREKLFVKIPYSEKSYSLEMYDITGQKVFEQKDVYNEVTIRMDKYATSTYFLKILENEKLVATYKLVRQE